MDASPHRAVFKRTQTLTNTHACTRRLTHAWRKWASLSRGLSKCGSSWPLRCAVFRLLGSIIVTFPCPVHLRWSTWYMFMLISTLRSACKLKTQKVKKKSKTAFGKTHALVKFMQPPHRILKRATIYDSYLVTALCLISSFRAWIMYDKMLSDTEKANVEKWLWEGFSLRGMHFKVCHVSLNDLGNAMQC